MGEGGGANQGTERVRAEGETADEVDTGAGGLVKLGGACFLFLGTGQVLDQSGRRQSGRGQDGIAWSKDRSGVLLA